MGTSTNGQIGYGIVFEEDFQFPWDEKYDGDIEEWWIYEILGYKNPIELYTEEGEYINGKAPTREQSDLYYDTRRKFKEANPLPVELVNICSGDYPIYMLAVPSSTMSNSRGDATEFNPENMKVTPEEQGKLIQFCKDHDIEYKFEPKWYLTSYWG